MLSTSLSIFYAEKETTVQIHGTNNKRQCSLPTYLLIIVLFSVFTFVILFSVLIMTEGILVATSTIKKVFSATNILKNQEQHRIANQWMNVNLILYREMYFEKY